MKQTSLVRVAIVLGIFLSAPLVHSQTSSAFFKDTFEQLLRNDPEFATGAGRHEDHDRWTDWSKAGRDRRRQFLTQRLAQLAAMPAGDSAQDALTRRVVRYDFESRLEAWELETHLLRVGQLYGFHNAVYDVIDRMPARTVHDYENIIARLRATPAFVDQNIGILDESVPAGLMQPRVVADLVIQQIDAQLGQDADHTELLRAFRAFPAAVPEADQQRLRRAAQDAYAQQFLPAWRQLHAYMLASYLPHVRPADSVSSIPGGRAAYAILIHRLTTTTTPAADIHKLGEQEVARIEGAMLAVLKETGFQGSLSEFEKKMKDDPAQHFKSKEEMLANARNIAKIIDPSCPTSSVTFRRSCTACARSHPTGKPPARRMRRALPRTFPGPAGST